MVRRFTRRNFLNLAAMAAAAPLFEVKALRGVDFVLQNSPTARKFLIETMPGGIALFDYSDGLLDISWSTAAASRNLSMFRKISIEAIRVTGIACTGRTATEVLRT